MAIEYLMTWLVQQVWIFNFHKFELKKLQAGSDYETGQCYPKLWKLDVSMEKMKF